MGRIGVVVVVAVGRVGLGCACCVEKVMGRGVGGGGDGGRVVVGEGLVAGLGVGGESDDGRAGGAVVVVEYGGLVVRVGG